MARVYRDCRCVEASPYELLAHQAVDSLTMNLVQRGSHGDNNIQIVRDTEFLEKEPVWDGNIQQFDVCTRSYVTTSQRRRR
jgi:hypothetical protein